VVLFAHGCHHSAGDLWPPSPSCPTCLGLPEERRLRIAALRRRLALVAVSSLDRVGKRCWAEIKTDGGANVAAILRTIIGREGLGDLPVYAMGASSGGQLALTLPQLMPEIRGVYAQVRGVDNAALVLPNRRPYPPAAFVHMPRDAENAKVIQGNVKTLQKAKRPVLEVRIEPRPLSVEFFTERSPLIDARMAAGIVAAFHDAGVASDDGTLLEPPRPATPRWAPLVQPIVGNLSLKLDESHVGELVNLAWAKHELVSDEAEAVLTWLQNGGRGGLEEARQQAAKENGWWEKAWGNESCRTSRPARGRRKRQ
jgi:hypothetical protein